MMEKNCSEGKDNWVTKIKNILCEHGFGIVWLFKGATSEGHVLSEIKSRLIDVFLQTWNTKMLNNEHHKFYFSYKSYFTPEHYLKSSVYEINRRTCLARFRCGVSLINAHRYKYYENELLRRCPFCTNEVEDEIHIVFVCTAYNSLRTRFIDRKFLKTPNLQTLSILISNEKYQNMFSKYLCSMFTARKPLLDSYVNFNAFIYVLLM